MVFAKNAESRGMVADLSSAEKSPANPPHATVKCPHCGTVMPASAAFCPGCGWSMTPLPPAERAVAAIAFHLCRRRGGPVSARLSQQPLCSFSCLAKQLALGSFFRFDHRRRFPFECRCRSGFSFVWNSGIAGNVFPVDGPNLQSLGRRALRVTTVRGSSSEIEIAGVRSQVSGKAKSIFHSP
jgi:hypothetical protein